MRTASRIDTLGYAIRELIPLAREVERRGESVPKMSADKGGAGLFRPRRP